MTEGLHCTGRRPPVLSGTGAHQGNLFFGAGLRSITVVKILKLTRWPVCT